MTTATARLPLGPAFLSYADGLAHARYVFRAIAKRAFTTAQGEHDYVRALALSWDNQLADLVASAEPMTDDDVMVLDHLVATAQHPDLSQSAVVEWVDAFPSAVLDLFAGAAVDLGDEFETDEDPTAPEVSAANKQSTLALAA